MRLIYVSIMLFNFYPFVTAEKYTKLEDFGFGSKQAEAGNVSAISSLARRRAVFVGVGCLI